MLAGVDGWIDIAELVMNGLGHNEKKEAKCHKEMCMALDGTPGTVNRKDDYTIQAL